MFRLEAFLPSPCLRWTADSICSLVRWDSTWCAEGNDWAWAVREHRKVETQDPSRPAVPAPKMSSPSSTHCVIAMVGTTRSRASRASRASDKRARADILDHENRGRMIQPQPVCITRCTPWRAKPFESLTALPINKSARATQPLEQTLCMKFVWSELGVHPRFKQHGLSSYVLTRTPPNYDGRKNLGETLETVRSC